MGCGWPTWPQLPTRGGLPVVVMGALGVRQEADLPVLEALRYRLRSADLLLVLDNCEHLLDACARLANALLRSHRGCGCWPPAVSRWTCLVRWCSR